MSVGLSRVGHHFKLARVWEALEQEPMLAATSEDQREEARKAVERAIFSEVFAFLRMMPVSSCVSNGRLSFTDLYGSTFPQH